jgi:chromatin remodeling complex protein RSC6
MNDEEDEVVNEIIDVNANDNQFAKTDLMTRILEHIDILFVEMKNISISLKEVQNKTVILKKDYAKLMKQSNKIEKKNIKKKTQLQCGFIKPRAISNEMCDFLEIEHGTLEGRNVITTAIHNYIVSNDLRDPDDRRIIVPNDALKKLLHIENQDIILSYFNIQTFLKIHFI